MTSTISEGKQETVKSSLLSAAGGLLGKILAIPVNLIVASVLGTTGYGVLAIINVIIQYLGYLNLGMLTNITREVPLAYGQGNTEEVRTIYGTISANFAVATCFGLMILWASFFLGFNFGGEILTVHLLIVTAVVVVANTHSFFYNLVKGEGQFITYGQYELVSRVLTPFGTLVLVWYLGLNGMLLSLMWTHIIGLAFLLWQLEYPSFRPAFNWAKTKELMGTGLLMYINKIIDGVFISIAIILAGRFLTTEDVGVLGFALGFASIKKLPFARVFSVTVNRKMAIEGGEHGLEDKSRFARYFGTPYIIYLFILSLLLGAMVLFYSVAVDLFLPDFKKAVPILQLLFFSLVFYNARFFAYSYINITRQMNARTLILAVGVTINAVAGYIAIKLGYGVMGIACSVALSMLVISVHTIFFVFGQVYKSRWAAPAFLLRLLIISVSLTGLLYGAANITWLPGPEAASPIVSYAIVFMEMALEGGVFALVSLGLHVFLFPREKVFDEVWKLASYSFGLLSRKREVTT